MLQKREEKKIEREKERERERFRERKRFRDRDSDFQGERETGRLRRRESEREREERSRKLGGFNAKITCQNTLNIYRSFDVSFISKSAGHPVVSIFYQEALWFFSL